MARNNNSSSTIASLVVAVAAVIVLFAALCVSAAAPLARSSSSSFSFSETTPAPSQERVYDFAIVDDDGEDASGKTVSWTAFGRQWIVRLELSDVVEDNTDYYYGALQSTNQNAGAGERNSAVDDDSNAAVSFALLPGIDLSGMISTGESTYWIRAMPIAEHDFSEEESDLGIFMVHEDQSISNIADSMQANFGVPLEAEPIVEDDEASSAASSSKRATITTYKLGVLFDQKWASATTNPWSSQANTLAILNDVNAVYKNAGLAQFRVVYLKQVQNSKKTLNDMLSYFSNTASANIAAMKDTSYTNYIWLVGTNVGGLAYVGTTCQGTRSAQTRKTAVAGLVSYSRLWTVKTIAHELGHNRGASHLFDNACTSSLKSNCQCSVMSYCFPAASNNPKGAVNFFADSTIAQMKSAGCY